MKITFFLLAVLLLFPVQSNATDFQLFKLKPAPTNLTSANRLVALTDFHIVEKEDLTTWGVTVLNGSGHTLPHDRYQLRVFQLNAAGGRTQIGQAIPFKFDLHRNHRVDYTQSFAPEHHINTLRFEVFCSTNGTVIGQADFTANNDE